LHQGGWIEAADDSLRLSATAYQWLDQPPELLLHDLRQTWFLTPQLTWRWVPAGRRQVPLDRHWRSMTLQALRAITTSPTTAWMPTSDLIADLEARQSQTRHSLAENLPKVRQARKQHTRKVLRFLFHEVLPRLGLVETRQQDEIPCLHPTTEGAAWLHAALDQYRHLTQPSHQTAVEWAVPCQELRFPPLEQPPLLVDQNLHLTIGLTAPAACTFQVAHFAQLLSPGPPARYQITSQSLEQALAWGYSGADVIVLLARYSHSRLPREAIAQLFAWQREMTLITCEPGYRLWSTCPPILDALRQRKPFRLRTQPFASGQDVWVSQAQAKDLLCYLRRLGYTITLPEHETNEDSSHLLLRRQGLPWRQLLVVLRTYQHLRRHIPGLADLGLQDLDQVLADWRNFQCCGIIHAKPTTSPARFLFHPHLPSRRSEEHTTMLPQLRLMRLRFEMEIEAEASLPPYKGDLLRRALLWHLGAIWCHQPKRCRNGCQSPHDCIFGSLLEPPVDPTWSEPIRRLMGTTPPPAYVLWDGQDRRKQVQAGDRLAFELVLIGQAAHQQLPAFIAATMVAGERGMGRQRLKARLRRVEALAGPDERAHPLLNNGVWQGDPLQDLTFGYDDGQAWIEQSASQTRPLTRLSLRYLSPVKVKMRGQLAPEPHFPTLARAVVRRLRILSQVHGAGEWPKAEYGPLLDLADEVQLEHHEITWVEDQRYSQRGGHMPLEGFVGQAWYASPTDLRPLLPALWLGQWVHVGKGAVWGMGGMR